MKLHFEFFQGVTAQICKHELASDRVKHKILKSLSVHVIAAEPNREHGALSRDSLELDPLIKPSCFGQQCIEHMNHLVLVRNALRHEASCFGQQCIET